MISSAWFVRALEYVPIEGPECWNRHLVSRVIKEVSYVFPKYLLTRLTCASSSEYGGSVESSDGWTESTGGDDGVDIFTVVGRSITGRGFGSLVADDLQC